MNCGVFCILEYDKRYALLLNKGQEREGKEPVFTPIGGGIKVNRATMRELEERLSLPRDSFDVPFGFGKHNQVMRSIRNRMPGERNLRFNMPLTHMNLDFLTQWLQERHEGRDLSPYREMMEELTEEYPLLRPTEVEQISFELAGYNAFWKGLNHTVPELKIMELYNLYPSEEVLMRMLAISQHYRSPLYFATHEEINAGVATDGRRIGKSAEMLFDPKPIIEVPRM
jgi:hypothetical protein